MVIAQKIIFIFALTGVLLTGCSKTEKKNAAVKVAYLPITHALPVSELEKSTKLPIRTVRYGSWPELLDALNTGRVDAALVLIEPAMAAKTRGVGLHVLSLAHRDGNVVVAAPSVKKADDLRGKSFAIPHRMSSHHILYREMLEKNRIAPAEVNLIELAPSEMPSALATGRIAGFCVAEPFGSIAVEGKFGHVLYRSEELWPDSVCCSLVVNDRFLNTRPELAGLLASEYENVGKRLTEKDFALENAKRFLKQNASVLSHSLSWISFDRLKLSREAYEELCVKLKKYTILNETPSYDRFVVTRGESE